MTDPLLDRQGVADHLGLALATIDRYRHDGRLPEPDVTLGVSPGWHVSTIEAWQARRPGQGWRKGPRNAKNPHRAE